MSEKGADELVPLLIGASGSEITNLLREGDVPIRISVVQGGDVRRHRGGKGPIGKKTWWREKGGSVDSKKKARNQDLKIKKRTFLEIEGGYPHRAEDARLSSRTLPSAEKKRGGMRQARKRT